MTSAANAPYEEWKLELPSFPPRSELYSLKPIGVGTPLVECLTSYISRLAEAHCVFPGMLMRKAIAPWIQKHAAYKEYWKETSMGAPHFVNTTRRETAAVVQALETLTQQSSLHFLTLLTWSEVFPPRRLVRSTQAWCPFCLEEQRTQGQVVYEPLLWTLQVVTHCMRHHCLLCTVCPNAECSREIPWLHWHTLSGYCPFCWHWLGASNSSTCSPLSTQRDASVLRWQQWVAEQLGAIFALAPTLNAPPTPTSIYEMFILVYQRMSQPPLRAFARSLGIPYVTVRAWMHHQQLPLLETLLSVCARYEISLKACLYGEITSCSFSAGGEILRPQENKHQPVASNTWNSPQVRSKLEAILNNDDEPPPSLKEVARQFRCSTTSVRRYHPELARAISARYLRFVQQRKRATVEHYCEEVRQAARQLVAQGKHPTRGRLTKMLKKPGILRSPEARKAWKEVLREVNENT